jgi:hypothetical protein
MATGSADGRPLRYRCRRLVECTHGSRSTRPLVRRGPGRAFSEGRVPCAHCPRGRARGAGGGVRASAAPAVDDARSRSSARPAGADCARGPAGCRGRSDQAGLGRAGHARQPAPQPTARGSKFTSSIWPTTSAVASSATSRPATGLSDAQRFVGWEELVPKCRQTPRALGSRSGDIPERLRTRPCRRLTHGRRAR